MRIDKKALTTVAALAALLVNSGCGDDKHKHTSLSSEGAIKKINKENKDKK